METKNKKIRAPWGSQGATKMVSFRMPIETLELLNSYAEKRGLSKNQIMVASIQSEIQKDQGGAAENGV